MPIFSYKCDVCGIVKDILVKRSEMDDTIPCDCETEGKLERLNTISNTSFILKGNWYKNNQSY